MASIEEYSIKVLKISMKNVQLHRMKEGLLILKLTSMEVETKLFKVVRREKLSMKHFKFKIFKNLLSSRQCECKKMLVKMALF